MNVYVYPTDPNWFAFLRTLPGIDEVNFWRPGGEQPFRQLNPGDLLLFRLRKPANAIVGGGTFMHFSFAPLIKAWEAFGIKNGAPDFETFLRVIAKHKGLAHQPQLAAIANIGCIVLSDPFFLPNEQWTAVPHDYAINSPQGQRFDAQSGSGAALLESVTAALRHSRVSESTQSPVQFADSVIRRRLGQGGFSLVVADAYEKRCAVTGERTYPVLEAAHIVPVSQGGFHQPQNGLLLRSDIHKLFDRGYVTVLPDGNFRVSRRLKDDWQNGRVYYDLNDTRIRRPKREDYAPLREFLEWHNELIFRR